MTAPTDLADLADELLSGDLADLADLATLAELHTSGAERDRLRQAVAELDAELRTLAGLRIRNIAELAGGES